MWQCRVTQHVETPFKIHANSLAGWAVRASKGQYLSRHGQGAQGTITKRVSPLLPKSRNGRHVSLFDNDESIIKPIVLLVYSTKSKSNHSLINHTLFIVLRCWIQSVSENRVVNHSATTAQFNDMLKSPASDSSSNAGFYIFWHMSSSNQCHPHANLIQPIMIEQHTKRLLDLEDCYRKYALIAIWLLTLHPWKPSHHLISSSLSKKQLEIDWHDPGTTPFCGSTGAVHSYGTSLIPTGEMTMIVRMHLLPSRSASLMMQSQCSSHAQSSRCCY